MTTTKPQESQTTMLAWQYNKIDQSLAKSLTLNPHAPRPPVPLPADKLLVRVTYMSPNPADHKIPELGRLAALMTFGSTTATPGMDYAGVIEEVGSSLLTSAYKPGQAVFGRIFGTRFGTLGTYIHASPSGCVPIPSSPTSTATPADYSTLGTAALTAYQALFPYLSQPSTPGTKKPEILINGGSGGVGSYAIQLAKTLLPDTLITTTCSTRNIPLVKSLGAHTVIDYTTSPTAVVDFLRARARDSGGPVFSHVIDCVGASPSDLYNAADDYLLPGSTYVQVGGGVSDFRTLASRALWPTALGGGKHPCKFIWTDQKHEDLEQLGQLMAEGKIRAVVDGDIYPYEDAPKAFEKLKTGRTTGKLVIKVSDK